MGPCRKRIASYGSRVLETLDKSNPKQDNTSKFSPWGLLGLILRLLGLLSGLLGLILGLLGRIGRLLGLAFGLLWLQKGPNTIPK